LVLPRTSCFYDVLVHLLIEEVINGSVLAQDRNQWQARVKYSLSQLPLFYKLLAAFVFIILLAPVLHLLH
jgi:hypothetical protein